MESITLDGNPWLIIPDESNSATSAERKPTDTCTSYNASFRHCLSSSLASRVLSDAFVSVFSSTSLSNSYNGTEHVLSSHIQIVWHRLQQLCIGSALTSSSVKWDRSGFLTHSLFFDNILYFVLTLTEVFSLVDNYIVCLLTISPSPSCLL